MQASKRIALSDWQRFFPDGVALTTYQRIGRLIRQRGTLVKITLRDGSEAALIAALNELERRT